MLTTFDDAKQQTTTDGQVTRARARVRGERRGVAVVGVVVVVFEVTAALCSVGRKETKRVEGHSWGWS